MEPHWEHYEHVADVGVRGFGRTVEEAFEQTALAVSALHAAPDEVREGRSVPLHCEATTDTERRLVELLNAVVYEMAVNGTVFRRFEISFDGPRLDAVGYGETIDPARHDIGVEVKGATFTDLFVGPKDGGYVCQCVVDV